MGEAEFLMGLRECDGERDGDLEGLLVSQRRLRLGDF